MKESKNQPIGDKANKLFRMWNVKFWMCLAMGNLNGFDIKHLRILNTYNNFKGI
jgi:hypothetical protein